MATKVIEEIRFCKNCKRDTLQMKNSKQMSWLVHIFMTIITAGGWFVIWLFIFLWHVLNKTATAIGSSTASLKFY